MKHVDLRGYMWHLYRVPFTIHHKIVADGEVVYEGDDAYKAWWAFVRAGKSGATYVSHLRDGVEMARSWAV